MPTVVELHRDAFHLAGQIDALPKTSGIRKKLEEKERGLWFAISTLEAQILIKDPQACVMGFRDHCYQKTKGVVCLDCFQECKSCKSRNWWFRASGERVCGTCHPDIRDISDR